MRFGLREALFVLLLLAMPVAAYFFVFQPRNQQIAEARAEIAQKQAKLDRLEAETKDMRDLGTEIDKLYEAISVFEKKLPAQQEVEGVLREVSELATRNKLQLRSVRTDKVMETAHYAELPIKMEIVGNFDGFYSFLLKLEQLPRITRMPVLQMKRSPKENDGTMQANVVLSIFFEGDASGSRRSAGVLERRR